MPASICESCAPSGMVALVTRPSIERSIEPGRDRATGERCLLAVRGPENAAPPEARILARRINASITGRIYDRTRPLGVRFATSLDIREESIYGRLG